MVAEDHHRIYLRGQDTPGLTMGRCLADFVRPRPATQRPCFGRAEGLRTFSSQVVRGWAFSSRRGFSVPSGVLQLLAYGLRRIELEGGRNSASGSFGA